MKVIKPSHKIMVAETPYKHIEKIGRTCYKSEDAITDTSAEAFVKRLAINKHHAMLEHFRFIVGVGASNYTTLTMSLNSDCKYITHTHDTRKGRYIISASARGLVDLYTHTESIVIKDIIEDIVHAIINTYNCALVFNEALISAYCIRRTRSIVPHSYVITDFDQLSESEYEKHAWYSVHFVCDRGVTHEMVRHRDASFAQESTRYCNYSKGKYDGEITVIEPLFWEEDSEQYQSWWKACKYLEETYMQLIHSGATAQEARSVLPNSLKTEIIITAQVYEWRHIFNLRVLGTTGAPHPQMKEVMGPVYDEMVQNGYVKNA